MHSKFLKKFIKETLYFSGYRLFLNKWNDESVVANKSYSPYRVLSPYKCKKKLCPYKILANFQIKPPLPHHYNGAETMPTQLLRIILTMFTYRLQNFLLILSEFKGIISFYFTWTTKKACGFFMISGGKEVK